MLKLLHELEDWAIAIAVIAGFLYAIFCIISLAITGGKW